MSLKSTEKMGGQGLTRTPFLRLWKTLVKGFPVSKENNNKTPAGSTIDQAPKKLVDPR